MALTLGGGGRDTTGRVDREGVPAESLATLYHPSVSVHGESSKMSVRVRKKRGWGRETKTAESDRSGGRGWYTKMGISVADDGLRNCLCVLPKHFPRFHLVSQTFAPYDILALDEPEFPPPHPAHASHGIPLV